MDEMKRHDLTVYLARISAILSQQPETPVSRILGLLNEMLPLNQTKDEQLADVLHDLEKYERELDKAAYAEQIANKRARRYANGVFLLGFGVLSGQMAYIGLGTFVFYSWDVMEPQAYLIGLGNLIYGMGYYNLRDREFTMGSIYNHVYTNRKNKLLRQMNVDPERLQFLHEEIQRLKLELIRKNS